MSSILIMTVFSGCCEPKVEYVDRPVRVNVPISCHTPDVRCDFDSNTYTGVIENMVECIVELKKSNEVCK